MSIQTTSRSQVIHPLSALLASISILLLVSFVVLIASMLAGLYLGTMQLHPNVFATYNAVWPGQTMASLAAFAQHTPEGRIKCIADEAPSKVYPHLVVNVTIGATGVLNHTTYCMSAVDDALFHKIEVVLSDGQVQVLKLFSDTLHHDTLLLYWGAPDAIQRRGDNQPLYLEWNRRTYSATALVRELDSMVTVVTLTAKD